MAKTEMIRAHVEPELKREAEELFSSLGLSTTEAITLFYRQVTLHQGLPFAVRIPDAETVEALEQARSGEGLTEYRSLKLGGSSLRRGALRRKDWLSTRKTLIYLLITLLIVVPVTVFILLNLLSGAVGGEHEISLNTVVAMTAQGNVETIEVKGDALTIVTTSGEILTSRKEPGSSIVEILQVGGVDLATSRVEIISEGQSGR